MPIVEQTQSNVTIPSDLLEQLLDRSESLVGIFEQLEDFYMSRNPGLIKKLREARDQHLKGDIAPFADLKNRYV